VGAGDRGTLGHGDALEAQAPPHDAVRAAEVPVRGQSRVRGVHGAIGISTDALLGVIGGLSHRERLAGVQRPRIRPRSRPGPRSRGMAGEHDLRPVQCAHSTARRADGQHPSPLRVLAVKAIQTSVGAWTGRPIVVWSADVVVGAMVKVAARCVFEQDIIVIVVVIAVGGNDLILGAAGRCKPHLQIASPGVRDVEAHIDAGENQIVLDTERAGHHRRAAVRGNGNGRARDILIGVLAVGKRIGHQRRRRGRGYVQQTKDRCQGERQRQPGQHTPLALRPAPQ